MFKIKHFFARQYAKFLDHQKFIGIFGSVGKSMTAQVCKAVLDEKISTSYIPYTRQDKANTLSYLSRVVLKVTPGISKIIVELPVEKVWDSAPLKEIVEIKTFVGTRLSYDNAEFLGGIDTIISENAKLLENLPKGGSLVILNWDDPYIRKLSERTQADCVFYGTDAGACHVWASNLKVSQFQTSFELNYGVERVEVRSKLLGFHQIYPLLAAAALGISLDIPIFRIKSKLENIYPSEHNMQAMEGVNGSVIIDDTANSSPIAYEQAIDTLNLLPARRRVVVFGEIKNLGEHSEKVHRQIARKIYKEKIDLVFTGGGDARFIDDELRKLGFIEERMDTNLQNPQIVSKLIKILAKGDVVLIKGSHAVRLDEVVKKISKKAENK